MTNAEITFATEQIKLAKYLDSLSDEEHIKELCSIHQCDSKRTRIHADQFLKRRWNPHPSERFLRWWMNRGWSETEEATGKAWGIAGSPISHVKAYNCEAVREVYRAFLAYQRAEMHNDTYEPLNQWDQTP